MRSSIIALVRLGLLTAGLALMTQPLLAGVPKGCSSTTQECLDHLAKELAGRGWVGLELERLENGQMKVRRVVEDGPAEAAGLRAGDILVAAQGIEYAKATDADWKELMKNWGPGQAVSYLVERDGASLRIDLKLGEMPAQVRHAILGAHMAEHAKLAPSVD